MTEPSPERTLPFSRISVLSLIFGIVTLLASSPYTRVGGLVVAVVAIVLGIVGMRRARAGLVRGEGVAVVGTALGFLGLLANVGFLVASHSS